MGDDRLDLMTDGSYGPGVRHCPVGIEGDGIEGDRGEVDRAVGAAALATIAAPDGQRDGCHAPPHPAHPACDRWANCQVPGTAPDGSATRLEQWGRHPAHHVNRAQHGLNLGWLPTEPLMTLSR